MCPTILGTQNSGPGMGLALALFDKDSKELERLKLSESVEKGSLNKKGQILLSDNYANNQI